MNQAGFDGLNGHPHAFDGAVGQFNADALHVRLKTTFRRLGHVSANTAAFFGELRPNGQEEQATEPDIDTFPSAQSVHTALSVAPSTSLLDPGGHALHVALEDAPVAVE